MVLHLRFHTLRTLPGKRLLTISVEIWLKQEGEETEDPETSYTKLIAVHAGLESKSVDHQMQMLKLKDSKLPRIEPLAGRRNVWNTPPVCV